MGDSLKFDEKDGFDEERVAFTITKLRKEEGELKSKALALLMSMSASPDHRAPLVQRTELRVLPTINEILMKTQIDHKMRASACKICMNLSVPSENTRIMASSDIGLIKTLVNIIRETGNSDAKMFACGTLWNLSANEENKISFMSNELQIVPTLVSVLREESGQSKVFACGVFANLSSVPDNKIALVASNCGLLEALASCAKSETGQARLTVCGILMNFSSVPQNKARMAQPAFGIIGALATVIKTDNSKSRICACGVLMNLSTAPENKVIMGANKDLLLTVVQMLNEKTMATSSNTQNVLLYTCGMLTNLSLVEENKNLMGYESLGLIPCLNNIIQKEKDQILTYACGILMNLSYTNENRKIMAAENLNTIQNLANIIRVNKEKPRLYCSGIIVSLTTKVNGEFLCPRTDFNSLCSVLGLILLDESPEVRNNACAILFNLSDVNIPDIPKSFVKNNLHTILLNMLREVGPESKQWPDYFPFKIMTTFLNLIIHREVVHSLNSIAALSVFQPMIEFKGVESRKAAFILTYLIGSDEATGDSYDSALYQMSPGIFHMIFGVYKNVMNEKQGKDYSLGTFNLQLIVGAVLELSVSDTNKRYLQKYPFIHLLVLTLELFTSNANPIPGCGGGGKDVTVACLAIEAIFQLSFSYNNPSDLALGFVTSQFDVRRVIKQCVDPSVNLATPLPASAREHCFNLLKRFEVIAPIDAKPFIHGSNRHAMLHFAESDAEKMKLLKRRLQILGYDIALFPESEVSQVTAIEEILRSHTVVMSISRQYKRDPNRRFEASLIHSQCYQGNLRIIYLMTDDTYTTLTSPSKVDGWLGIMVDNQDWFALYTPDQIESIAKLVGIEFVKNIEVLRNTANKVEALESIGSSFENENKKILKALPKPTAEKLDRGSPASPQTKLENSTSSTPVALPPTQQEKAVTIVPQSQSDPKANVASTAKPELTPFVGGVSEAKPVSNVSALPTPSKLPIPDENSTVKRALFADTPQAAASQSSQVDKKLEPLIPNQPQVPKGDRSELPAFKSSVPTARSAISSKSSCQLAWDFLQDPTRVKDFDKLSELLFELGILEPNHLTLCDADMFLQIISHLKPVQKKLFVVLVKDILGYDLVITNTPKKEPAFKNSSFTGNFGENEDTNQNFANPPVSPAPSFKRFTPAKGSEFRTIRIVSELD